MEVFAHGLEDKERQGAVKSKKTRNTNFFLGGGAYRKPNDTSGSCP